MPHYIDVIIMSAMAYQITSLAIVNFNRLFRRRWKKTSKLHVTGLYAGNSPVTGEFPTQSSSNAELSPFDYVIMFSDVVNQPIGFECDEPLIGDISEPPTGNIGEYLCIYISQWNIAHFTRDPSY